MLAWFLYAMLSTGTINGAKGDATQGQAGAAAPIALGLVTTQAVGGGLQGSASSKHPQGDVAPAAADGGDGKAVEQQGLTIGDLASGASADDVILVSVTNPPPSVGSPFTPSLSLGFLCICALSTE